MRYYLGPYVARDMDGEQVFCAPASCVASIDLAPLAVQATPASFRSVGLFVTEGNPLPSEWTEVGSGDCREIKATGAMRQKFKSLVGHAAKGDTLAEMVYDCLTDGADALGDAGPLPLIPFLGSLDVTLGRHGRIASIPFEYGKADAFGRQHWRKIKQIVRRQIAGLRDDAAAGRLKDRVHHRRVLDYWCAKLRLDRDDDWKELVPESLQAEIGGRLIHETTYTESWPTNSTTISSGQDNVWTELTNDVQVATNRLECVSSGVQCTARLDSDLSGVDHYAQSLMGSNSDTANSQPGLICRKDSSATNTFYFGRYQYHNDAHQLFKVVAGTSTQLGSDAAETISGSFTGKLSASGSTIAWANGSTDKVSVTDTAITGNLRCGIRGQKAAGQTAWWDDFVCADLSTGIIYTQLERSVRGVLRGVFTRIH